MNAQEAAYIMVNTPRLDDRLDVAETFESEVTEPMSPLAMFDSALFNARRDKDALSEVMLDYGKRLYLAQEKARKA